MYSGREIESDRLIKKNEIVWTVKVHYNLISKRS